MADLKTDVNKGGQPETVSLPVAPRAKETEKLFEPPFSVVSGIRWPAAPAKSHDAVTDESKRLAGRSGFLQGLSESQTQIIKQPESLLYDEAGHALDIAGTWGGYLQKIVKAGVTVMAAEKSFSGTAAMWKYDLGKTSNERYERMAGFKAVAIPFTAAAGIEPSEELVNLILTEYVQSEELRAAKWEAVISTAKEAHAGLFGLFGNQNNDGEGGFGNISAADRQARMRVFGALVLPLFAVAAAWRYFEELYGVGRGLVRSMLRWPFSSRETADEPGDKEQRVSALDLMDMRYGDQNLGRKIEQSVPKPPAPRSK